MNTQALSTQVEGGIGYVSNNKGNLISIIYSVYEHLLKEMEADNNAKLLKRALDKSGSQGEDSLNTIYRFKLESKRLKLN